MTHFPLLLLPLTSSPLLPHCVPFYLLGTLQLCQDRPPQSQVACKLTPFAPPFTQPTPPLQIPESQLPSALQRRPREHSGSCYPEQVGWPLAKDRELTPAFQREFLLYSRCSASCFLLVGVYTCLSANFLLVGMCSRTAVWE